MGWHVARMGEERGVYRVLLGKPEGRRPLGRPRRRWVDNIWMDLQEVGCGYMDWIGLAQDRDSWRTLVSAVMNLRVSWNAGNFLTSCQTISFSRRTLHHGVSKYKREFSTISVERYKDYPIESGRSGCVTFHLPKEAHKYLEVIKDIGNCL